MTIKDFSGGEITRAFAHLTPANSAVTYLNCDNEQVQLCPVLDKKRVGEVKKRWVYDKKCDRLIDSDEVAYWATLNDVTYQAAPGSTRLSKVLCDGTLEEVGIAAPENAVNLTVDLTQGKLCGTYSYLYTYVNSAYESAPSPVGDSVSIVKPDLPPVAPVADPDHFKERQQFVLLGGYLESIRNTSDTPGEKVEYMKCALDKYTFTEPRLKAFITKALGKYRKQGLDAEDKFNAIMCLIDGYPEAVDVKKSFSAMYKRIQLVLSSEKLKELEKPKVIGCILDGIPHAEEVYNPRFHELVLAVKEVIEKPYPADAYVTEPMWRLINLECMVTEEPTTEVEETEVVEPECKGSVHISGLVPKAGYTISLYRIGGDLTVYTLVARGITTDSYFDLASDDSIAGNHVLDTFSAVQAPLDGQYLTEYNSMLFLALGSTILFSDVNKPANFPPTNSLVFPDEVTGIGAVQNGMLVFTRFNTYILVGNSPATIARYLISDEQGCVNHDTIAFNNNSLYWLSTDGICTSSGGNIDILTQDRLGRLDITDSINAIVFDRMYMLSYGEGCLILDKRYKYCIRRTDDIGWLGKYKDKAHIGAEGKLYDLYVGTKKEMHYISPIYNEGRLTEYKIFKNLYIAYHGDIHAKVYLYTHDKEREKVFDRKLDHNHLQHGLKLQGNMMGYGLQIELIGTGCVQEIDFQAFTGREKNGK